MRKMEILDNKILKLSNVCLRELQESDTLGEAALQLRKYIKSKGAQIMGPLVQCLEVDLSYGTQKIYIMQQINVFFPEYEMPYYLKKEIRSKTSLFIRYTGKEEDLHFAYQKIAVDAYEREIELSGKIYTVLTGLEKDDFSADIFVEKER